MSENEEKAPRRVKWETGFRKPETDEEFPKVKVPRPRGQAATEAAPASRGEAPKRFRPDAATSAPRAARPSSDRSERSARPTGDRPERSGDRAERPARPAPRPLRIDQEARPWVRKLATLQTEKGREREGTFLAEGLRVVEEVARHSPVTIVNLLHVGALPASLAELVAKSRIKTDEVTADEMRLLSGTVTDQGVAAVCNQAALKPKWDTARFVTLVDAVQDPGNLGALFRTSLGFGMDALVLGSGTCDPFNSKVIRGSSGTFLRVPFEHRCDLAERIHFLRAKGFTIIATTPHAKTTLDQVKLRRKVAFLVGNEGAGADSRYMDMADERVSIPMAHNLESLNVAVAHGIIASLLWQARQP